MDCTSVIVFFCDFKAIYNLDYNIVHVSDNNCVVNY